MGANEIIDRDEYMQDPIKSLDTGMYAGGVDTVGGDLLAKMLSMITNQGSLLLNEIAIHKNYQKPNS